MSFLDIGHLITCVYCGHQYKRPGRYAYCPNCGADPDEELVQYSKAAGWCDVCDDENARKICKETGLCPKA